MKSTTTPNGKRVFTKTEKGRFGENAIDIWMESKGWIPVLKNHRFRGGEIDRLYLRQRLSREHISSFCLAEIKYVELESFDKIKDFLSEINIKRLLKPKQMRNLYLWSEKLAHTGSPFKRVKRRIHIRLFAVLFLKNPNFSTNEEAVPLPSNHSGKLCFSNESYCILSFTPEFVPRATRTSLLQIGL